MKSTIHYIKQLLWFIVLHFRIDVHSCFAVFMPCKILNRLGVNARIEEVRDVSVPLWHNKDKSENPCVARVKGDRELLPQRAA